MVRVLDHRQTTDAGADINANALGVFRGNHNAGVLDRLNSRCKPVMDKNIHAASFLGGNILGDIEPFDLAGDLGGKGRGVEPGNPAYSGFAGKNVRPRLLNSITDRRNYAQAGDDDSAFRQDGSSCEWLRDGLKQLSSDGH